MAKHKVIYVVDRIKSKCPVFKLGDKFVLEDYQFNLKESTAICLMALQNYPFWLMHARGSDPISHHVGSIQGEEYFACPYPGEPYTECGGVIFKKQEERARLE